MLIVDQCAWNAPGADPFHGEVPAAVARYTEIPPAARAELRRRMERHDFDDVAEIRRDTIKGRHEYADMRSMHFGKKLCRKVSRAKWTDTMVERGLVYCVEDGRYCVIVPTVCSNVSLVTRLVPRAAPPAAALPPEFELPTEPPAAVAPPPAEWPPFSIGVPETFEEGSGPPAPWWPPVYVYSPPSIVFVPGPPIVVVPPVPAIPEPSTWLLMVIGAAALAIRARR